MFKDLLSSRLIQAGLAFFVLVVGGSLLYSWHVQRTTEKEMARHARFLQGLQNQNETRLAEIVIVENGNETAESVHTPTERATNIAKDTETPVLPRDSESFEAMGAFLPADVGTEETLAEEVPVSPYGFGPYPEVPEDLPLMEPRSFDWTGKNEQDELVMRVMIKAWTEGDRSFRGAKMVDGKVLLYVPNTAHFRYRETTTEDGSVVRTRVLAVAPDIELPKEFHPGVRVLHFDEAAIDPYEYLDLL